MFIKILTPNHNGKIELTIADLEALIKEAVDKAISEDRANRSYIWYSGNTLLNNGNNEIDTTPNIVYCDGTSLSSSVFNSSADSITAKNNID